MKKWIAAIGTAATVAAAWFWFFGYECGWVDALYLVYVSCAPGGGGSGAS